MIILDENLRDARIREAILTWFPGQVTLVTTLRPRTVVKDDAIPSLLQHAAEPTFVTINVVDFWRKTLPHPGYCVVCVDLPKERAREIPDLLRRLFQLPPFRTRASRMGKIVRLTSAQISYYETDRRVHSLTWPT